MAIDREETPERTRNVVALSDTDVENARRLLQNLICADEQNVPPLGQSSSSTAEADLAALAQRILAARRRRPHHFPAAIFGELAWDILLLLFIMEEQQTLTVGVAAQLLGAPGSTTSRWIDYLKKEQLIARSRHPTDDRVMFVALTDKGKQSLELYLSALSGLLA